MVILCSKFVAPVPLYGTCTTTTTANALTTNAMTSTANHWFNLGNRNYAYFLQADWENKGHVVGMEVTSQYLQVQLLHNPKIEIILLGLLQRHTGINGTVVNFSYGGDTVNPNYLFQEDPILGATTGTEVDFDTSNRVSVFFNCIIASLLTFGCNKLLPCNI